MSRAGSQGTLLSIGIKSLVFTLITVAATAVLASTIRNSSGGASDTYTAIFSDATSLNKGDDVRISGVKVGTVRSVSVTDNRLAKVDFTVRKGVPVDAGSIVQLRFRNMIGQRYIAIEPPPLPGAPDNRDLPGGGSGGSVSPASDTANGAATTADSSAAPVTVKPGHVFGLDDTRPALDLTVLFNGFRPLMQMLNPDDVNKLSAQIIAVFQGEGATVDGLLKSTASLTSTLAKKDQVIGELISSLGGVMTSINDRSGQLDTTLVTLQQLVSGLSADRKAIGRSIGGMGALTTRVAGLLKGTRAPLRDSISDLGVLSTNLDDHSDEVQNFLTKLPVKLDRIGRLGSYGSWLNFYMCSMKGRIPMPQGYMGDLGVKPVAGRCR